MIAVCGEALIDLVPEGSPDLWRAVPGGGPANTAVALARLGVPARFLGRLSSDTFGQRIRAHLASNGVDLDLAVAAGERTTLALVDVDAAGGATYSFYLEGTADWQWSPGELPAPSEAPLSCVHAGTLAALLAPGDAVLRGWLAPRRGETVVSYDVNVRPAVCPDRDRYLGSARAWLDIAHIVKASEDDLAWLYPGEDPVAVARSWMDGHDLTLALLTRGASGVTAVLRDHVEPVTVPAAAVEVVDTVGAGDAFAAGVLVSLSNAGLLGSPAALRGAGPADIEAALRVGTTTAAITCTRAGAQPPYRGELPVE